MDTELDSSKYIYTDYIVLALRVDAWSIPATTLKIYTEAEVQRVMEEQKQESLSRYEVSEIKERVKSSSSRERYPPSKPWTWCGASKTASSASSVPVRK